MSHKKITDFKLSGVIVAPITPFKENFDVNYEFYESYVQHLVDLKVNGVYVNGTTGEFSSLTVTERKKIAETWMDKAKGRLNQIIIHVGTTSQRESIDLAQHAQEIGADAIACVAPFYFKPESEEALLDYMIPIGGAAPNLPFYYYDIDFMTGVHLNVVKFMKMAAEKMPTLRGLKYSSRPLLAASSCMANLDTDRLEISLGTSDLFLPMLTLGIESPVTVSPTVSWYHTIRTAMDNGDIEAARREQCHLTRVATVQGKYGSLIQVAKASMKWCGLNPGPPRPPLTPMSDEKVAKFKEELADIGYFDYVPSK